MGREPFEAVVAAHHAEIYRYLRRVTARPSEAEDLSQEAFLRAFRAYRTLSPDANVRAWMFAIATNLYRNHVRAEIRRRAAHATVRGRSRESDGEGPEGEALFNEARAVLERVIDGLPLKQRLAFVLRKVHDLSYDEIGRSLECSAEAARAHVFQAFRKIRHGLEGHALPRPEVSA
ncbi:MAG: RNA polymerase sigma factor [Candidatus Rokuibacteriota bacterium]